MATKTAPFNVKCVCGTAYRIYNKPNHAAFPKNPFGFAMSKSGPVEMTAPGTFQCRDCGATNKEMNA